MTPDLVPGAPGSMAMTQVWAAMTRRQAIMTGEIDGHDARVADHDGGDRRS
jgi:hypothetical protein